MSLDSSLGGTRCVLKNAICDSDPDQVRCGPLCGLKSDISRGQESARSRRRAPQQ
jgi:hypothetical protein